MMTTLKLINTIFSVYYIVICLFVCFLFSNVCFGFKNIKSYIALEKIQLKIKSRLKNQYLSKCSYLKVIMEYSENPCRSYCSSYNIYRYFKIIMIHQCVSLLRFTKFLPDQKLNTISRFRP